MESEAPKFVLSDSDAVRFIARDASELAVERLQASERRWRSVQAAVFTGFVGVVGFLGYRSVDQMEARLALVASEKAREEVRAYTGDAMKAAANDLIAAKMAETQAEASAAVAYLQFATLSKTLNDASAFSPDQRDAAVSLLQRVAKTKWVEQPEFREALANLVKAFAAADLAPELDEIDSVLHEVAIRNKDIVLAMIQHYGPRALGGSRESEEPMRRLGGYVQAAKYSLQMKGIALAVEMAMQARRSGTRSWDDVVRPLVDDAAALEPMERVRLLLAFRLFGDDESSHGEQGRMAAVFRKVRERYAKEFDALEHVDDVREAAQQLGVPGGVMEGESGHAAQIGHLLGDASKVGGGGAEGQRR